MINWGREKSGVKKMKNGKLKEKVKNKISVKLAKRKKE